MRAKCDQGGGAVDRGLDRVGPGWSLAGGLMSLVLAASPTSNATAEPPPTADPVLARIDFEDRETATADWSHVFEQAPGLPRRSLFFDAVVDETVAFTGGSSLRLDLEGGSISYRMRPEAAVPILPDADYRISARVRTEGLRHAEARLEIRVVDGRRSVASTGSDLDPIAESTLAIVHAMPSGDGSQGGWVELAASIGTDAPLFRGLQDLQLYVALQVVQPGFDDLADAVPEIVPTVRLEDIDGHAWFDEIEVRRSPRLRVTPVARSGIQRGDGPIEFEVVVDDPTAATSESFIELRRADGRVIDRRPVSVDSSDTRRLDLTADGPGWFEAVLRTRDRTGRWSSRSHAVVVLPESDRHPGRESPRFGVSIARWTPESLDGFERTLDVLDPDAVEWPIWPQENDGRPSLEGVDGVRRLLDRQRRAGREPMVVIDRLHGGLAATARVEPHAVRAALDDDADDVWRRAIGDWMERLGTAISRWRIDGGAAVEGAPRLFTELARTFVADPVVLVNTPFDRIEGTQDGDEPCRVGGTDLGSAAQSECDDGDLDGGTLLLAPPPDDWMVQDRIDAAARRGLAAWRAGADRILLKWDPFASPDASLVAWSGLARGLGSRRFVGEVRGSDSLTCLVGDDGYELSIVAWSDLVDRVEVIRLPVGTESVEILELDGRRRRVATEDGLLTLEIGATPRFVLGADRLPMMIAATTRFDPTTLGMGRREHSVDLVVRNPLADLLEGELRFDPPPGWTIEPARPRVRASGGETVRVPLTIVWSGPQPLGSMDVPMRLDVRAPRPMRIPIDVPIALDSEALVVDADWSIARGGRADESPIILTVEIENVGDRPLDLELAVSAWRVGRERRIITGLAPGEREVRRLRIRAGLDRLAGTDLRVEVRELEGPESIALEIPLAGDAGITSTAVVPTP